MVVEPPPPPCVVTYAVNDTVISCAGLRCSEAAGDSRGGPLARAGLATGAAQWPAGVLLCDYLVEQRHLLHGANVVELGCGLGLCGLVAASLAGPSGRVVLTDGDADCCARAAANVLSNARADAVPCVVRRLRWGDAAHDAALLDEAGVRSFDLVIGGDVVYDDGAEGAQRISELVATADRLLSPTGVFLLGFQRRSVPLGTVLAAAAKRGLVGRVPDGEFVEDAFGNRVCELTDFWQTCVLSFAREPLPPVDRPTLDT